MLKKMVIICLNIEMSIPFNHLMIIKEELSIKAATVNPYIINEISTF
jgi:hypothetical protein